MQEASASVVAPSDGSTAEAITVDGLKKLEVKPIIVKHGGQNISTIPPANYKAFKVDIEALLL